MTMLKLVCLTWLSQERDKYVWEDRSRDHWDVTIGRMYLLKAHDDVEDRNYATALTAFEQALLSLSKNSTGLPYYYCALADKSLVQCYLAQYGAALATLDQALATREQSDRVSMPTDTSGATTYKKHLTTREQSDRVSMLHNRGAILVLIGAFTEALNVLYTQIDQYPQDSDLRFTLATCLLHLERYDEAVTIYEQVMAEDRYLYDDKGLKAAQKHQQPDWISI